MLLTHTQRHQKKGISTQTIKVNPEVKGSQSGPGESRYQPCTGPHLWICFGSLQRGSSGPLYYVHTWLEDFSFDIYRQGPGVSIPSSSPAAAAVAGAPGTLLGGAGRTRPSLGNGISKWEATLGVNGMATGVTLRHLQLNPVSIMKNISIYNEAQERFIKEIYSLQFPRQVVPFAEYLKQFSLCLNNLQLFA